MTTEKMVVAPKQRTRSEVQELVAEFMSKRYAAKTRLGLEAPLTLATDFGRITGTPYIIRQGKVCRPAN
jgi:hypothetical protein